MIVGVLGGGQLARMLALAAHPLGIQVVFIDPSDEACAAPMATQLKGAYDDPECLRQLAEMADVITYEFENVSLDSVRELSEKVPVHPAPQALQLARDRWVEKNLFRELDINTADYRKVDDLEGLERAAYELDLPAILKTRREGYDGKGQVVVRKPSELPAAWASIGELPAILEAMVPFEREVSVLAARDVSGHVAVYPLSENVHKDGILHIAQARPGDAMQAKAEAYAQRLLNHMHYVGVMTLELFQVGDEFLANEFAPRVHNSGHWTIEGAETSQFENHMRAVAGMALGSADAVGHAAMINCIGEMPARDEVLELPHVHLHDYTKSPRPGRKIAHVTVRADEASECFDLTQQVYALVGKYTC